MTIRHAFSNKLFDQKLHGAARIQRATMRLKDGDLGVAKADLRVAAPEFGQLKHLTITTDAADDGDWSTPSAFDEPRIVHRHDAASAPNWAWVTPSVSAIGRCWSAS